MPRTISQPYPSTLIEVRKFTYRELLEMERIGIIQEDQYVELLGGQIVVMTIHPPHAATVSHLNELSSLSLLGHDTRHACFIIRYEANIYARTARTDSPRGAESTVPEQARSVGNMANQEGELPGGRVDVRAVPQKSVE